jgi:hypothetical protein
MPDLVCSICLYIPLPDGVADAATVINGHAVCIDHLGYVAGPIRGHDAILRFAREQEADTTREAQQ